MRARCYPTFGAIVGALQGLANRQYLRCAVDWGEAVLPEAFFRLTINAPRRGKQPVQVAPHVVVASVHAAEAPEPGLVGRLVADDG